MVTAVSLFANHRYDDMDWVRGRPPDALLFLKAAAKAASSGMSLSCSKYSPSRISSAQTGARAAAAAAAAAASSMSDGDIPYLPGRIAAKHIDAQNEEDKPRTAEGDSERSVTPSATNPSPAGRCDAPTAATPSAPDAAGVGDIPLTVQDGSRVMETSRMTTGEFMPGRMAGIQVSESRALAEGALLGPLRDVGTISGALRSRVGGGLREMAAAR